MSSIADDVKEIERLLSRPSAVPNEFSTWITKWLAVNMDISTYQLRGLASTFFKAALPVGATVLCTTAPPGADLGGPTLDGLSNGSYLCFWGANMETDGADAVGGMSVATNLQGASDEQVAKGRTFNGSDAIPIIYSRVFDLSGGADDNWISARYMKLVGGGNPRFGKRWLVAVKIAKDV